MIISKTPLGQPHNSPGVKGSKSPSESLLLLGTNPLLPLRFNQPRNFGSRAADTQSKTIFLETSYGDDYAISWPPIRTAIKTGSLAIPTLASTPCKLYRWFALLSHFELSFHQRVCKHFELHSGHHFYIFIMDITTSNCYL